MKISFDLFMTLKQEG